MVAAIGEMAGDDQIVGRGFLLFRKLSSPHTAGGANAIYTVQLLPRAIESPAWHDDRVASIENPVAGSDIIWDSSPRLVIITGLLFLAGLARRTRRSALVLPTFTRPNLFAQVR